MHKLLPCSGDVYGVKPHPSGAMASLVPVWDFDKPTCFAYTRHVSTKRNIKPFSRNPKTKTQVLATKSSLRKASQTFLSKPKASKKIGIPKIKTSRSAVQAPVVVPLPPQPAQPVNAEVEQANKLAITLQLTKINDALKAFKLVERAQCDASIQAADTKAIAARAAVYLKAKKAGKFPATWTYPKSILSETNTPPKSPSQLTAR